MRTWLRSRHADVEFHAPLIDLVVETEVLLTAQRGALDDGIRIEAQELGGHRGREIDAAHIEVIGDGLAMSSDLGWSASLGLSTGSAFCLAGPLSTGSSASLRHRAHPAFSRHKATIEREAHSGSRRTGKQAAP